MMNLIVGMMLLIIVSVGTIAQAQQSAFQGTWVGEEHRSSHKLEISGNNWSHFINNVIQAAGTARFSSGKAELLLANGNIYFDFTLLAPGLIQQPITMWDGLYRFRHIQPNTSTQNNSTPRSSEGTIITENIFFFFLGKFRYNFLNSFNEIENLIFIRTGRRINLRNVNWSLNTSFLSAEGGNTVLEYLNERLKEPMNRYNVNYAMTTFEDIIVINKRDVNQWYFCIIE
jgi:hypothetical protein